MERRCPDHDVAMVEVGFEMSNAYQPKIKTTKRSEGILGALGYKERRTVQAYTCPECGLVRFYADLK